MKLLYPKIMHKYLSQYPPTNTVETNDGDDEKLFGDTERFGAEFRPESHTGLRLWLTHGVLICTSILSFTLWMRTPSTQLRNDIPGIYSPANVAIEPVFVRFNGTLDFPSIYRGPPSPEVDAAWNRISIDVRPTQMTREEMLKAGATNLPSKVRLPDKIGGGYMVSIEATHQMHCVNLLRKASWAEYYGPIDPSFQSSPEIVRMHFDHCVEMIRQNIMCHADVTMITWNWVEGHTVPYPNFNTRHQCRNFEKIIDWSVENAVHIDASEVTRLEDAVDLPELHFSTL
ncbi:hypothetical protein BDR04DRAFT_1232905 [Suillus decipiens]|nr:hypothetical protein BDR04DRAFT_1232905 [Suillus decipiens]